MPEERKGAHKSRQSRHIAERQKAGWVRVDVMVPSAEAAAAIRKMAAEQRALAERREEVDQVAAAQPDRRTDIGGFKLTPMELWALNALMAAACDSSDPGLGLIEGWGRAEKAALIRAQEKLARGGTMPIAGDGER